MIFHRGNTVHAFAGFVPGIILTTVGACLYDEPDPREARTPPRPAAVAPAPPAGTAAESSKEGE